MKAAINAAFFIALTRHDRLEHVKNGRSFSASNLSFVVPFQRYWRQTYRVVQMKISIMAALIVATQFFVDSANAGGCANNSNGQVICAPGGGVSVNSYGHGCAAGSNGEVVCAPPGGGAEVDINGQVVTGRGGCARNSNGQVVCGDTPGGGAAVDSHGQVKTGPGECITDSYGKVMCSSQPGGGAAIDSHGRAVCAGGCVAGQ
jgi:hypothetical protein